MNAVMEIEALRPEYLQSVPVFMDQVFDDPEAIWAIIKDNAPYQTVSAYHGNFAKSQQTPGWFRKRFEDDIFLQNPRWIEAAKQAFSAEFVRPLTCLMNLNVPGPAGACHVDIPEFRGLSTRQAPLWLLINMGHSRLFQPWMVPFASGLVWFYRGANGGFEYWLNGTDEPPCVIPSPMWNIGLMSDNEIMYHRIGAVGSEEDQKRFEGIFRNSDTIRYADPDRWEVYDGDTLKASLAADQIRISFLWKALVFRDQAHLASFENPAFDLTLEQVVEIFDQDLRTKGIAAPKPADPFEDEEWRRIIEQNYMPPYQPGQTETKRR